MDIQNFCTCTEFIFVEDTHATYVPSSLAAVSGF